MTPSQLPEPVREVLRDPVDEVAVQRMWKKIANRRAAERSRRARDATLAALGAAAAAVVLLVWTEVRREREAQPAALAAASDAGPLRTAAGAELGAVDAREGARSVALSDGSRLALARGARLDTLENNGRALVALLASGRVVFDVQPHGPRRWSIECGVATVEVVGTRFVVDREGDRVRVDVERGIVLVRGERVPERVARLTAGQSLVVGGATAVASRAAEPAATAFDEDAAAATEDAAAPRAEAPSRAPAVAATEPRARGGAWRELAQRGAYGEAYGTLGAAGLAREAEHATPDALLALADVARLSGHPADAVAPLEQLLAEYASDPAAPLAAFTLGRVELDALGRPAPAVRAFEQAVRLGVPRGLLEDALARLVEARTRAGDVAGAREAAADYLARFPNGRHAEALRRATDAARADAPDAAATHAQPAQPLAPSGGSDASP